MLNFRTFGITFFMWMLLFACLEGSDKFIVLSPPKCGTHLIGKTLSLLLEKNDTYELCELGTSKQAVNRVYDLEKEGSFLVAHNWSRSMIDSLIHHGYKVIFITRDPRDHIISVQDWLLEGQWGWLKVAHMASLDEQLDELITGSRFGFRCYDRCIKQRYEMIKKYIPSKCYVVRFENLVGPSGGGTKENQINELINISTFLKKDISVQHAENIAEQLFGGTSTFRVGRIGRWKERFKPYHIELFNSLYFRELKKHGY